MTKKQIFFFNKSMEWKLIVILCLKFYNMI